MYDPGHACHLYMIYIYIYIYRKSNQTARKSKLAAYHEWQDIYTYISIYIYIYYTYIYIHIYIYPLLLSGFKWGVQVGPVSGFITTKWLQMVGQDPGPTGQMGHAPGPSTGHLPWRTGVCQSVPQAARPGCWLKYMYIYVLCTPRHTGM